MKIKPLIVSRDGRDIASISDYSLDMQYALEEPNEQCNFLLNVDFPLKGDDVVYMDGTPYGGIIDWDLPEVSRQYPDGQVLYKGRTVQGILAGNVICPPSGQTHKVVSGNASTIITDLISQCSLSSFFIVGSSSISIPSFQFRYTDLFTGICRMLAAVNAKLKIVMQNGKAYLHPVSATEYGKVYSERVYFSLQRSLNRINGLIGLGKGIGTARAVSAWYADKDGKVSRTRSIYGIKSHVETYQLTSSEQEELDILTKEKLIELQKQDSASIELEEDTVLDIGDMVQCSNAKQHVSITAQIVQVIVKVSEGNMTVDCLADNPEWPIEEE